MKAIVNLNKYVNDEPKAVVQLTIDCGTKKGLALLKFIDKATDPIVAVGNTRVEGYNLVDILEDAVPA